MKKRNQFPKSGGHGGQQRNDGRKPTGGGGKSRPGSFRAESGRGDAGRGDSGRAGAGRAEGGRSEGGRSDSKQGKPFRPGSSRPGSSRSDSPRNEPKRYEGKRAEAGRDDRGRSDSKHGKPFRPGASRPGSSRSDAPRNESKRDDFKRDDFKRADAGRDDRGRAESKHGKPFRPGASRPSASRPGSSRSDSPRNDSKRPDAGRGDRGRPDSKQGKPFRPGAPRPGSSRPAEPRHIESDPEDFESYEEDFRPVEPRPPQARPASARPASTNKGATHPGARSAPRDLPPPALIATPAVDPRAPKDVSPSRAGEVWLYGHHAVAAAVANPSRKILRLMGTAEALVKLTEACGPLGQARTCSRREIDVVVGADAVHQGVALLTRALEYDLADVLEVAAAKPNACIVVLDQVTDPHNVGAILRSAAAFGASAVIAPDRNAADESGAMAKSASGALDKIPYVKAINLVRALEQIKEHQFWLVGLDADAEQTLGQIKLDGRIALVLGAEGEGLRRLVRETCDHVARLPMAGDMESLNVSNAGAVALYEKVRQDTK
jgi:23S rRNA (guanosine2251-2'-O)-methyltransferase